MLEVRDLEVQYGKIRAVYGLSLNVVKGEIVALIGANGAGKSSTMHAICGIERANGGQVHFEGENITGLRSHQIIGRGLVQVPEGRLIFGGLTIEENLRLGAYKANSSLPMGDEIERVLMNFPMLKDRLSEQGTALSGGQAQMLALARAMMARPKLLMLDEPSLGLAPIAVEEVYALIETLPDAGVTVLLVEQNVRQALAVADRGYVIESGKIIIEGKANELLNNEHLINVYMGLN